MIRPVAVALSALLVLTACSSSSETAELEHDPADATVPGHLPTAPPVDASDGEGLTSGANALLAELEQVQEERDLCAILTGAAFEDLIAQRVDPAGLVTNPAGLTRLISAVDATFRHMVDIAPPEIAPSMQVLTDVWTRLAALGPVDDVEGRVNGILAEPQVAQSNQAILAWAATNCAGAAGGT